MTTLASFPHIEVPWTDLDEAAHDMASHAEKADEYLGDAQIAWSRLRSGYQEAQTQAQVYAGLDDLSTPAAEWSAALVAARDALVDFAFTGPSLQNESEALTQLKPSVEAQLAAATGSDDPSVIAAAEAAAAAFNGRATALTTSWDNCVAETAAALQSITGGDGADLPSTAALHSLAQSGWATFTSGLNERFGTVTPAQLLASLRGLSDDELRAWADANPEAAQLLADNVLMGPFDPGSAEDIMNKAMSGDAALTEEGIAGIRTAFAGLPDHEQERLLLLYPGVFGNLNGIPFSQRVTANTISVAGHRETVAQARQELGSEPTLQDFLDEASGTHRADYHQAYNAWRAAHAAWSAEDQRLTALAQGLDYALDHDTQVLYVSLEGDGRIATMVGTPSADTQIASVMVPGTGADLGSLESYTDKLDAVDGAEGDDRISIYWQGTDLPDEIPDNLTSSYNEQGAPHLAAFDRALDLELSPDVRSTYIGYSAGGSLLGTAEREGLDSTNILYVAPAGTGHNVSSPGDTANPDAHRYLLQTRDDPIAYAQGFGGGYHGGSFLEGSNPVHQMGATRLETGFKDPTDPTSVMGGHTDYFIPGSTSAQNIQGVIEGTQVSEFVPYEHHYGFGYSYLESPLETRPEDYTDGQLPTVPTDTLE